MPGRGPRSPVGGAGRLRRCQWLPGGWTSLRGGWIPLAADRAPVLAQRGCGQLDTLDLVAARAPDRPRGVESAVALCGDVARSSQQVGGSLRGQRPLVVVGEPGLQPCHGLIGLGGFPFGGDAQPGPLPVPTGGAGGRVPRSRIRKACSLPLDVGTEVRVSMR